MPKDPETLAHLEWLGYVQPVGLVVSIPALLAAQAHINRNILPQHQQFLSALPHDKDGLPIPDLRDFPQFTRTVLGWRESDLEAVIPDDPRFAPLGVVLPEYHETLRPTHVVREYEPKDAQHPWMMLIQVLPAGTALDDETVDDRHWQATPQAKFERLMRETRVPIGLLVTNEYLRLVYAPRGETSGYATFSVAEMMQVAGRPIFAALHMLLCEERLFSLGEKQRLPAILSDSRKYQNQVSNELSQQVLAALYELLRGFQAADAATHGELLRAILAENPNHVYQGLLTVLLRLVFVLYAEDRGLLSSDPVYANFYSVTGLYDRLRSDDGRFPDTMDQRYGAWSQLLTLCRLIYDGGSHGGLQIPARRGYLFDPARYPFLEGQTGVPRVSDGVVFRVLNNLLILDGERLNYRTLDVEQIGSVYETMMGFVLEVAAGRSIAVKPKKSHGAPTTINLDALLVIKPAERNKWLKANADQELTGQAATAIKEATTVDALLAALDRRIAKNVTPNPVAKGSMVFQPSEERRRSGSHYTPRSLTEPIVRRALEPILKQLGNQPTPQQILDLKICDPAKGSGAFLVEACRQLGDELVKAWHAHACVPKLPPDEDEVLHARRLVAQRCLYGVDKNPMAVDLAKLSLWLVTLAKDHPFTFLDHALRCGDSLVGLTTEQIRRFHWLPGVQQMLTGQERLVECIEAATRTRRELIATGDDVPFLLKQQKLAVADETLNLVRFAGNLVIAAYFSADNDKQRKLKRDELLIQFSEFLRTGNMALRPTKQERELLTGERPVKPFHWEIEFPEVFGRENGGFDVIVGNPPFLGGSRISTSYGDAYLDWLLELHADSHGNGDIVAHFFRRTFGLLRSQANCGLIATNTIAQGDTRITGLRWLCTHNGTIYRAQRRYKWPGQAAVVVSVIHFTKGEANKPLILDGRETRQITAFLFHSGGHDNPAVLQANARASFAGYKIYGQGFTFDNADVVASPVAEMHRLISENPRNAERIFPYIGGEELNDSPTHAFHRYAIDFFDMTLEEANRWPDLLEIVRTRVKPERDTLKREALYKYWWHYGEKRPGMRVAIRGLERVLVCSLVSHHLSFAFLPGDMIYSHKLAVFPSMSNAFFGVIQSRLHEVWARFFSSSLEDRLNYTPSDCFETFPFPENFEADANLKAVGQEYYEFRAALMVKNNEGLTKTYNRFHDPEERSADILKLRELHAAMDRAVLEAYGWHDLAEQATCEFLLDYEDEEDDAEESSGRRRKKPWRYRWPDLFRDEVLARLLDLNQKRAEEERLSGVAAEAAKPKRGKRKAEVDDGQSELFRH